MAKRGIRIDSAHLIAIAALIVALGGTAYALTRNQVKSKHIAPNAVRAKDVKDLRWQLLAANADCESVSSSSSYRQPAAAIDAEGVVHLRGAWRNCSGVNLVDLPAKFRPGKGVLATIVNDDAVMPAPRALVIQPNGHTAVAGTPGGTHVLEDVTYARR